MIASRFGVFRFRNEASKVVKLLLVDDAEGLFERKEDRTPQAIEESVALGETRLVTVVIHARGQTEVPVRGKHVLLTAGFKHSPNVYERFCELRSYRGEHENWISITQREMRRPENSFWTDISLSGARRVAAVRQDEALPSARRRTARAETVVVSEEGDSPRAGEDGPEQAPEQAPAGPVTYKVGQDVQVYSRRIGGWFQARVEKVHKDGTVRVKFEGAFQKEVPPDQLDELLKPAERAP